MFSRGVAASVWCFVLFLPCSSQVLGHFVRIYESTAVEFVRESARWSESPERIAAYVAAGNRMSDIHNISHKAALKQLKPEDRLANSRNDDPRSRGWPYQ